MEITQNTNYLIFRNGAILSKGFDKFHPPRFIKKSIDNRGYYICILSNNKKKKTYQLHRLIALQFIPNPHNKTDVDHIDGNKLNNNINNLRWLSHIENCNAFEIKRRNNKSGYKNISWDKVNKKWVFQKIMFGKYHKVRIEDLQSCLWYKFCYILTQTNME